MILPRSAGVQRRCASSSLAAYRMDSQGLKRSAKSRAFLPAICQLYLGNLPRPLGGYGPPTELMPTSLAICSSTSRSQIVNRILGGGPGRMLPSAHVHPASQAAATSDIGRIGSSPPPPPLAAVVAVVRWDEARGRVADRFCVTGRARLFTESCWLVAAGHQVSPIVIGTLAIFQPRFVVFSSRARWLTVAEASRCRVHRV